MHISLIYLLPALLLTVESRAQSTTDSTTAADSALLKQVEAQMQAAPEPQLDGSEAKVWKALSLQEAISIDSLLSKLPFSTSDVYSALLALEVAGHIRQLPGKKYIRRL